MVDIDHHLNGVAGAVVASLGVDDDGLVFAVGDDVGSAGQGGGLAAELEPVLAFNVHLKPTDLPIPDSLVDEGGVFEHPLGLVEVGGLAGPVSVAGLEPNGPFAGVLAGQ